MKTANVISVLFHPLLLTTYLCAALGFWLPSVLLVRPDYLKTFLFFIFGITFLLPVLNIFLFKQYGLISSWKMESRTERLKPFVLISVLYVLVAVLFIYKVHLSVNFTKLLVVIASLVVSGTVITFFYKISLHSLGWWGLLGILLPLNRMSGGVLIWAIVATILISGFVMSARLRLNAHNLGEVLVGALVGFAISFSLMDILFR